jgi:transcription antitermination factor NusG
MASDHKGAFYPGQTVHIIEGMFIGLQARIIGIGEAIERKLPLSDDIKKQKSYWVIMSIFGRDVPVVLTPNQMTAM